MTPKERAAMQQALEALETLDSGDSYKTHNAASALREALAEQAEQEPVAWMNEINGFICKEKTRSYHVPLYAAPVRTVDLTDDEIWADGSAIALSEDGIIRFARAVIAADRQLNGVGK